LNLTDNPMLDYEYYLLLQVPTPIEQLCKPIEDTNRAQLAECPGRRSDVHPVQIPLSPPNYTAVGARIFHA
jgi:hypothetical protein